MNSRNFLVVDELIVGSLQYCDLNGRMMNLRGGAKLFLL